MRFFFGLDSVVEMNVEVEGEMSMLPELGVGSGSVMSTSGDDLSAGCLAGRTISGLRMLSVTPCSCVPSTYPISPHFDGEGRCDAWPEETVNAITTLCKFVEPAPSELTGREKNLPQAR